MSGLAKKVVVYSLIGLMQVGLFAAVAEASPREAEMSRYEDRRDHRGFERAREHRLQEENRRHEHEMRRRPFESRRAWHERQKREIERHRHAVYEIMHMGHRW